mmetsp:Transcript_23843/g.36205  ORF Transcript_23843/g.36205 Transcript_23843/m.36205 type:complete len:196 (+) Transcript_23843:94-681(+)
MSKLSEYSKFDHLEEDSDSESNNPLPPEQAASPQAEQTKDSKTGRYVFSYGGQKVYEWEQTLETVTLYIEPPPNISAKDFNISISSKKLKVGLKGRDQFFLDDDFFSVVDTTESTWFFEGAILQILIAKQHRGEAWLCVLGKKDKINPMFEQELKQQLLRERFQEENPGMDFRDASFNGSAPDPRTYMGGIGYDG